MKIKLKLTPNIKGKTSTPMKLFTIILITFFVNIGLSQYYTPAQINNFHNTQTASSGNMYLDTINNKNYIGLPNGELGKILPFDRGLCELLKPKLNPNTFTTSINSTFDITITGYNFSEHTTLAIAGISINSFSIQDNSTILANITAGSVGDTADIVVSNTCGFDTIPNGLITLVSAWKDLRAGGDVFTIGNGGGNDIRHKSGMNMIRNTQGMRFTGANPWQSWVKFESMQFTRGAGKTVEFVFQLHGSCMVGLGSLTTTETSSSQYKEGAVLAYFSSTTRLWGLYGSSPTNGTTWNQSNGATINTGAILKVKIENDGSAGSKITIYEIPSANPSDWDDETTIISSITSTNGNVQSTLVPFLIPRNSANNYYLAVKVL